MEEKKDLENEFDYTILDKKICQIVKKVEKYMTYYEKDYIKEEIFKAYKYAKEAH
jgi:hypothetical protein